MKKTLLVLSLLAFVCVACQRETTTTETTPAEGTGAATELATDTAETSPTE